MFKKNVRIKGGGREGRREGAKTSFVVMISMNLNLSMVSFMAYSNDSQGFVKINSYCSTSHKSKAFLTMSSF